MYMPAFTKTLIYRLSRVSHY